MKQKARVKTIQKATITRVKRGQPVTEIVIYGQNENGETYLLERIFVGSGKDDANQNPN